MSTFLAFCYTIWTILQYNPIVFHKNINRNLTKYFKFLFQNVKWRSYEVN